MPIYGVYSKDSIAATILLLRTCDCAAAISERFTHGSIFQILKSILLTNLEYYIVSRYHNIVSISALELHFESCIY